MPTLLTFDDLERLIEGAAFLGSGGGGPVSLARKLLKTMEQSGLRPRLVDWSDLSSEAWVASVAGIGSPNAAESVEAPFTTAPRRMVKALEESLGRSLDVLIPDETGPMNSLIPMVAATQLDLPVLDGDGAGRAMATLAMSTFNEVAPVKPYLLGNETPSVDDQVTAHLTVHTPEQADTLTRGIVSEASFGSSGAFSTWPCQVGPLGSVAIQGSVSQAIAVGQLLENARKSGSDPLPGLQSLFGARMRTLYTGTIDEVNSHTAQGFDITQIRMASSGQPDLTVYALNENMMAWRDDLSHPLGVGPDSLCYVSEDGHAFTNAHLSEYVGRPDKKVHLVGLEALPALRKPVIVSAYRSVLLPMGYPGPYRPLTEWNDD